MNRRIILWLLPIWLMALVLALVDLGNLPLRDWDEGIVARVALETSGLPWPENLLPQYWGDPYRNKPPGIHLMIAAVIQLWRHTTQAPTTTLPPEWVVRLAPALLSTAVVPLVGLVQARLRPREPRSALASAAIALTLLPLVRHGRLAMLDGSQLSAMVMLWWAVLSTSAGGAGNALWGGLAGISTSFLLLLKAPAALPLLVGTLLIRWLDRVLLRGDWWRLLAGLLLGLAPGLLWHGLHLLARGSDALEMWTSQGFSRLAVAIEGNEGGPLVPLLEMLKGGGPWLLLWPFGMALAWRERQSQAGRWCLGLTLITAVMVLPLRTQLPWYSLLLWPSFALVCGPVFAWLIGQASSSRLPAARMLLRLPMVWAGLGALLLLLGGIGLAGGVTELRPLAPLVLLAGVSLVAGGGLGGVSLGRRQGAAIGMLAGLWLTLLLLLTGPLWLWELNETWPVPPVATLLERHGDGPVRLWRIGERPSLNWYVGRRIRSADRGSDLDPDSDGFAWLLSQGTPEAPPWHCQATDRAASLTLYRCLRNNPGPPE